MPVPLLSTGAPAAALTRFNAEAYFTDAEGQAELLADAFDSGDAAYIKVALGTVARARGMAQVERDTGITRKRLYRALGAKGNLKLDIMLKLTSALGFHITIDRKQRAKV